MRRRPKVLPLKYLATSTCQRPPNHLPLHLRLRQWPNMHILLKVLQTRRQSRSRKDQTHLRCKLDSLVQTALIRPSPHNQRISLFINTLHSQRQLRVRIRRCSQRCTPTYRRQQRPPIDPRRLPNSLHNRARNIIRS